VKDSIITIEDAQAVNFREIRMGEISPKTLYRSSHPIKDNKQEKVVSMLASFAKIAAVINLCDTNSGIAGKAIFAPWYNKLLKNNRVIALGMDFSFADINFGKKLKKAIQFIIGTEGPWLIHCHAGVDRTGFVCMVLESYMGSSLDDVINDYLNSSNSVFESSINEETHKADSLMAMQILSFMGIIAPDDQNLQAIAENYLRKTIRLSSEELELLKRKLSGVQGNNL
jgi:hypothetical protein